MAAHTQRLFLGHMGCYAALPGLATASDYVARHGRPALLLCLELTTLHIQPPTRDPQQIVAHALFSDAAAAVVLMPAGDGYAVTEVAERSAQRILKAADQILRAGVASDSGEVR